MYEDDDGELRSDLWIRAGLRECHMLGVPAMVVRKGDPDRGSLTVKLYIPGSGCRVLNRVRDELGRPAWMAARKGELLPEHEADEIISRAMDRDPALWVVEIEHRDGWHPWPGKLLE